MHLGKTLLLGVGYLAAAGHQHGDVQIVQGRQILDLGGTNVDHLQAFTICQGGQIGDIVAEGDFQILQLLAVFKGTQILDGSAGENDEFQIGHAPDEFAAVQPFIVAEVDETHILAVH